MVEGVVVGEEVGEQGSVLEALPEGPEPLLLLDQLRVEDPMEEAGSEEGAEGDAVVGVDEGGAGVGVARGPGLGLCHRHTLQFDHPEYQRLALLNKIHPSLMHSLLGVL